MSQERDIQHAIRVALGSERDIDLERRNVGMIIDSNGRAHRFGTVGEADLQGILAPAGRFFALEVKQPGKKSRPEQVQWADRKRMRGAFVAEVHSVEEARAALDRARRGENR